MRELNLCQLWPWLGLWKISCVTSQNLAPSSPRWVVWNISLKVQAKHKFCGFELHQTLSLDMSLILTKNVTFLFISKRDWHIAEIFKLPHFFSYGHYFFMITLWFMGQFATQISDDVSELFTSCNRNIVDFHFPCQLKYLLDSMFALKKNLVHMHIFSVLEYAWDLCTVRNVFEWN